MKAPKDDFDEDGNSGGGGGCSDGSAAQSKRKAPLLRGFKGCRASKYLIFDYLAASIPDSRVGDIFFESH